MASLYSFIWITVCILLQVMVFDHLHFYGSIVLVYLLPLMKMPVQIGRSFQIFLGFICGLFVDIFFNRHARINLYLYNVDAIATPAHVYCVGRN